MYKHNTEQPMILEDDEGKVSLPRALFRGVFETFLPYKYTAIVAVLELSGSILLVAVVFSIAIEYQVFKDFTVIGESFLTLLTVMLPRLFGMLSSSGFIALKEQMIDKQVEAYIRNNVVLIQDE